MMEPFPIINIKKTGENIGALREGAGMTVKDLQVLFGFETPQAIYKWQRGLCLPSTDNLVALSRIFGVALEEILVVEDAKLERKTA